MHRELPATTHVVVYPQTFEIHHFALPIGILPGGDALHRRTHHITTNVSGVRDYMPGDSFGRIHWPSTARRDRLIAKEFELDPLADIWIALDMSTWSHIAPRRQPEPEPEPDDLPWMRPVAKEVAFSPQLRSMRSPLPLRWPNIFCDRIGRWGCWPMVSQMKWFRPTGASGSLTAFWKRWRCCGPKGSCRFRIC
jgi:hypothetical protein